MLCCRSMAASCSAEACELEKAIVAMVDSEGLEVPALQVALKKAWREATELPVGVQVERCKQYTSRGQNASPNWTRSEWAKEMVELEASQIRLERNRSIEDSAQFLAQTPTPFKIGIPGGNSGLEGSIGSCVTGTSPSCETQSSHDTCCFLSGRCHHPADAHPKNPQGNGRLDGRQECGVEGCNGVREKERRCSNWHRCS